MDTVNQETSHVTFQVPEMKIAEFANSIDLDEVVYCKPPHIDPHYLPSGL